MQDRTEVKKQPKTMWLLIALAALIAIALALWGMNQGGRGGDQTSPTSDYMSPNAGPGAGQNAGPGSGQPTTPAPAQ